jgi:hypothetical protein
VYGDQSESEDDDYEEEEEVSVPRRSFSKPQNEPLGEEESGPGPVVIMTVFDSSADLHPSAETNGAETYGEISFAAIPDDETPVNEKKRKERDETETEVLEDDPDSQQQGEELCGDGKRSKVAHESHELSEGDHESAEKCVEL